MLWIILVVGIIVAILIYAEYIEHDCLPHKSCNKSTPKPRTDDNPIEYIDKIRGMVRNNYDFVSWRLALLAGIIVTLPIVYYLKSRVPTPFEWFVITMLVFAAAYLSNSWIWAHFFQPNGNQIEKYLLQLRDKIHIEFKKFNRNFTDSYSNTYSNSYSNYSNSNSYSSSYNNESFNDIIDTYSDIIDNSDDIYL